jgi:lysine-N-methylase
VPAADHWRIGVRFACPSAAANHGRPLTQHDADLETYAGLMAVGEGVVGRPANANVSAPLMRPGQAFDWPDLLRFVEVLLTFLRDSEERMERRLRKCLAFDRLCRQAKMEELSGNKLAELLHLVAGGVDAQVPAKPEAMPAPSWIGRILFRQILALLARKDEGGDRGIGVEGRLALLRATWRFARGRGPIPRVHGRIPEATFEQVEIARRASSVEMERTLQRYYITKVGSLQFCGPMVFNLPFWEGLETLLATFPVICWLTRLFADLPGVEAVQHAIAMVDRHFGYNPLLGTRRQRLAFRILARMGELDKLIAWYGR